MLKFHAQFSEHKKSIKAFKPRDCKFLTGNILVGFLSWLGSNFAAKEN